MIPIPITLGPTATRELLVTAIADLLARTPSSFALQEPEPGTDGWVATGTFYARDSRERAAEDLALIEDVGRLLRKHHGRLARQRRAPGEEDE
jgi:hypothetical protein